MTAPPKRRTGGAAVWLLVLALIGEIGLLIFAKLDYKTIAIIHVGFFSVVTFLAFTWDKWCARRGSYRVSEATLLTISVLGGALGGLGAMLAARHKTRRVLFWTVMCASLFIHVTLVGWLFIKR
jgi:uncharacterized membrane protein YsdA (DUF1294 family)